MASRLQWRGSLDCPSPGLRPARCGPWPRGGGHHAAGVGGGATTNNGGDPVEIGRQFEHGEGMGVAPDMARRAATYPSDG
jgi:hypothetical protein